MICFYKIFYFSILTGDSNFILKITFIFKQNFISLHCESSGQWGVLWFGLVCDRLVSPSDLVKSGGGGGV